MAIAVTQTVTGSGLAVSSVSLTSWTPGSNELVLLAVATRATVSVSSVAGNGLTWANVLDIQDGQNQCRLSVWRAMGASPSAGQITATLSGTAAAVVAEASCFSGIDTGGTNGSAAVEASNSANQGAIDTNAPTVSLTTVTNNAIAVGYFTHRNRVLTVGSGYTAISINNTVGAAGDETRVSGEYKLVATAGATTVDASLSATTDWVVIAVSVKPAVAGSTINTNFTASVSLQKQADTTFTASVSLQGTIGKTFTAAASLQGTFERTFTASVSLTYQADTTFTASVSLQGAIDKTFTAAVSLRNLHSDATFTAAVSLTSLAPRSVSFTASVSIATLDTTITPVVLPNTVASYEYHYLLKLVNNSKQYVCDIDQYIDFDYTLVVNDVGVLNLRLPGDFPRHYLQADWAIEIWRSVGQSALHLEGDTQFLIQTIVTEVDDDGNKSYSVTAYTLNHILRRRVVAYSSDTIGYGFQIDEIDGAMKAVVRQNVGSLAIAARNLSTHMSVDADFNTGQAIEMDVSNKYVLDALKDMANTALQYQSSLFFEIVVATPPSSLVFRVFTSVRGTNRRATTQNALILSHENGSIGAYTITEDYDTEINHVYAYGPGEGDLQLYTEATNTQAATASVFARKEYVLTNQEADTLDALDSEARAALVANRVRKVFQGKILNVPSALYGVHWFFGDWVTTETEDGGFDCFVAAIHVTVNKENETIEATLRNDT